MKLVMHRIRLLFWTVRYLSFGQVSSRLGRMLRLRLDRWFCRSTLAGEGVRIKPLTTVHAGLRAGLREADWRERCQVGLEAIEGRFLFLGQKVEFSEGLGWNDPRFSQLWRYHLHYFHYVIDIVILANCRTRERAWSGFRQLVDDWIGNNRRIEGDGWHPYTISLRAVNWIEGLRFFDKELKDDPDFENRVSRSLLRQAEILHRDREFDVRGNHLIENLRALVWLGLFLDCGKAKSWFCAAMRKLEEEVAEQVLADGGHFERSPGYHLVVMKDLLEIGLLLYRNEQAVPPWLKNAIWRMSEHLRLMITPTGRVPLLKDTALDAAPNASDVGIVAAVFLDAPELRLAGAIGDCARLWLEAKECEKVFDAPTGALPDGAQLAEESGLFVARDNGANHMLVLDVGRVCPSYLPAHGHADMFSFELFVDGEPVIVDSGVYEYTAGPWRDYFRSTRAHNTLELAGGNQSEVWSSFRVARRAHVQAVETGSSAGVEWCRARHDGYRRLSGAGDHVRCFLWVKPDLWIVIDEVVGARGVAYENHLHFHPQFAPDCKGDGNYVVSLGERNLLIQGFGNDSDRCVSGVVQGGRQGWCSEEFGVLQANHVVSYSGNAKSGEPFGYVMSVGGGAPRLFKETTPQGWTVRLEMAQGKLTVSSTDGRLTVSQGSI